MTTSRWRNGVTAARLLPTFLALGLLKRIVPLPTLAQWAWRHPARRRNPGDAAFETARIAAAVLRVGAIAGVPDRDCLQRSLLLYRELSAAGMRPVLRIGFRRHGGRLLGHAWVHVKGGPVIESDAALSAFEATVGFGDRGKIGSGRGTTETCPCRLRSEGV